MGKFSTIYDRSRVPLYLQVASVMRQRINSGRWAEGEKISTLEELEEEFGVGASDGSPGDRTLARRGPPAGAARQGHFRLWQTGEQSLAQPCDGF